MSLSLNPARKNSKRTKSAVFLSHHQHQDDNSSNSSSIPKLTTKNLRKPAFQNIDIVQQITNLRNELINESRGWNSELEQIVKQIGEDAYAMSFMHDESAHYFQRLYRWIGYTTICLTLAAATGAVTQIRECNIVPGSTDVVAISVVILLVSIFMYLTSVVEGIKQFRNWGARAQHHIQSKVNFSSLYKNIKIMMGSYRRDRQNGKDYAEWVAKAFDDLNMSSPSIPKWAQKKYDVHINGVDINNPNRPDPILIKKDSPVKDIKEDEDASYITDDENNETTNNPNNGGFIEENIINDPFDSHSDEYTKTLLRKGSIRRKKSLPELDEQHLQITTNDDGDININFKGFNDERRKYELSRFFEGV